MSPDAPQRPQLTTLVLVPGLLCDSALWAHQTRFLAPLVECLVPDITRPDSIEGLAQAVLAQAPAHFALAGLSLGGIIAHAIMAIAPARVTQLALVATTARPDTAEQTARRQRLIGLAERGDFDEIPRALLPTLLHPARVADPELERTVMAMAKAVGATAFIRQITAVMHRPDRRSQLAHYRVPTLVLCGREDAITPLVMAEEMTAAIPGSKLAILEECGHLATLERPQAVTALLRHWLLYG